MWVENNFPAARFDVKVQMLGEVALLLTNQAFPWVNLVRFTWKHCEPHFPGYTVEMTGLKVTLGFKRLYVSCARFIAWNTIVLTANPGPMVTILK